MLTRRQHWLLVLPLILILVPFLVWPALFGFFATFTNYAPFQANIRFVGIDNYVRILQDSAFLASVRNVVIFVIGSVSLEMIAGVGIAYLLRERFRGRGLVKFLLLVPWLVSPVASGIMWRYVASTGRGIFNYVPALLGLPDVPFLFTTELALPTTIAVEFWRKVPLVIFLTLPGLLAIPSVYWDQAKLDGMGVVTKMRYIVLPRLRLLLLTITLLLIGDALGLFESILMLTGGGPGIATLTPGFYSYKMAFSAYNWVAGAASGWLIVGAVVTVGLTYLVLTRREQR